MPEKNYCKRDRHPCPEKIRLSRDEKIWRSLIDCPRICCISCSKKYACEFGCFFARDSDSCPDQCTIQEKVFSKILEKKEDEFIFI